MSPRGARGKAIAPGIYPDADGKGFEVAARAAGDVKWKRFKKRDDLGQLVTLGKMKAWQDAKRKELREAVRKRRADLRRGTFAGDVAAHLATMTLAQRKAHVSLYNAWLTADLAGRARAGLTIEQLRTVVSGWVDAGVAASTINHRRRALIGLYEALDGDDPPVLPRRIKRQVEPEPEPQDVDMALLDAIIGRMRDFPYRPRRQADDATKVQVRATPSRVKAQLRFLLWTGMSPATMGRLDPATVNLERAEYRQPRRRKGKGAMGATVPLWHPEGLEAARAWLAAKAHGRVSKDRLLDALQRAVRSYVEYCRDELRQPVHVPPGINVRTLRHSFLTLIALKTEDPRIVQLFGQHKDLKTSTRYTLAAIAARARAAAEAGRVPRSGATEIASQPVNSGHIKAEGGRGTS